MYLLRLGVSVVTEACKKARLVSNEFALHSWKIGGATRLTVMGASPRMIEREDRWSSSAFMAYVRANMEDSQWVFEVLSGEK